MQLDAGEYVLICRHHPRGKPPAIALGGILDNHDVARVVWVRKNFIPGRYVLHCAMPMSMEAKAGEHQANHADAGMVLSLDVN